MTIDSSKTFKNYVYENLRTFAVNIIMCYYIINLIKVGEALMSKIRALIVGVSDYSPIKEKDLPFCKNDIYAIRDAFVYGLNLNPADIIMCGQTNLVKGADFIDALQQLISASESDDTIFLYFSGHGTTIGKDHYLVFSDKTVKTQQLIECLEKIKTKNKVLFLDCCLAGNFNIEGTAAFDINKTVEEFAGKGYAILASCNKHQYSYPHPDKPISLFTYFLCQALTFKPLIRDGKKSLHDIRKLLFILLECWNKNNPTLIQNPIYRANIGGTIFFDVQNYHSYKIDQFYRDYESYTIYSVKPIHSGIAKRYSVQIILKKPMLFSEIATINHEIIQTIKGLNIFVNEKQEKKWKNKNANIIFCLFGFDETDMKNNNYICHTTWVDETQDKDIWYKLKETSEIIDGIHFNVFKYYRNQKSFIKTHTATKETILSETTAIISRMITLAEQIVSEYNEYLNGTINENNLKETINAIEPELTDLYLANTNLDISPDELKEWSLLNSNLAGSIHDLTLYYNQKAFIERSSENRKSCMDMSINQYYNDLEKLKTIDTTQL